MIIPLTVFVNSTRVEIASPATALDAVRRWSAGAAREVEENLSIITDSRGLPLPPDAPVHSGSILRLVPVHEHTAPSTGDSDPDSIP